MKPTLVFADVHLKVTAAEKTARDDFVRFLRSFDPADFESVIILGDLFDFWFEYRPVIFSGYFEVLRALAEFRDAGTEVHLICGNHDFWAGRFLRDDLGIKVHPDSYRCTLSGRNALFVHGDGINQSDRVYRAYKVFARTPWVVSAFRFIHPDWAMRLAQGVSHTSRTLLAPKDPSQSPEARVLREYARQTLENGDADLVFCGHSHFPVEETFPTPKGSGLYVNTGDWQAHRTYLICNRDEIERKVFGQPRTEIWPASKQERTVRIPGPIAQKEARQPGGQRHQ
jgi:UDP-2,3-diacylglucosamine hydrolase